MTLTKEYLHIEKIIGMKSITFLEEKTQLQKKALEFLKKKFFDDKNLKK